MRLRRRIWERYASRRSDILIPLKSKWQDWAGGSRSCKSSLKKKVIKIYSFVPWCLFVFCTSIIRLHWSFEVDFKVQHLFSIQNQKRNHGTLTAGFFLTPGPVGPQKTSPRSTASPQGNRGTNKKHSSEAQWSTGSRLWSSMTTSRRGSLGPGKSNAVLAKSSGRSVSSKAQLTGCSPPRIKPWSGWSHSSGDK